MISDDNDDDDFTTEYSLDVPTDEEEEDVVRHFYQEHEYEYEHDTIDEPAEFPPQQPRRMTPPSVLVLPTIITPTVSHFQTPPPRSPRTRRFTSLPLHLEESLTRESLGARSRSATSTPYPTSLEQLTHPVHATMPLSLSDFLSEFQLPPPSPRPRRLGCSRVLLVLVAYVGLMLFPHPPLLQLRVMSSTQAASAVSIPKLENELITIAPTTTDVNTLEPPKKQQLQKSTALEQQQQLQRQEEQPQSPPPPKRRLRQPVLAHARTNNRQRMIFYGGKPSASLLFLDHMEETPLQQRTLPRFFFAAGRNVDGTIRTSNGRRSFFKTTEHNDDQQQHQHQQQQQQQQNWVWWILYKLAWLILLGCTLEAGVREIPRRFQTLSGPWFGSMQYRSYSSAAGASHANHRHDMTLSTSSTTTTSPPPPLSRAFSTPRRRRL